MKVCIIQQNQYAKVGHAIARQLKEAHGINEFLCFVFSPGAERFLKSQSDIKYIEMLVDHKLHAKINNEPIDIEYIKEFEQKYSLPPIWHHLYTDRKLMMSMGPKEETTASIDPMYSHENLMRSFLVRAKPIEAMLQRERPDVILFFAIGALSHMILYHVAKKLGIKTVNIDFPRFGKKISLSQDFHSLTETNRMFEFHNFTPEELEQARLFINNFRNTGSLNIGYYETFSEDIKKNYGINSPRKIIRSIQYLYTLTKNYLANRSYFTYGITDQNPLHFILHQLKRRWRKLIGTNNITTSPLSGESYCYFPLHYEPELATLLLSPYYFDQIELIKSIARSLPFHLKLYVKEHPAMKNRRPIDFYKKLLKIPNVRLIKEDTPGIDLVKGAEFITTITGTAGWEAALLGKPVLTFGDVFYNSLPSVTRVHDIEKLPEYIRNLSVNNNFDEGVLERFVASLMADSFDFDFNGLWYENDVNKILQSSDIDKFCKRFLSIVNSENFVQ